MEQGYLQGGGRGELPRSGFVQRYGSTAEDGISYTEKEYDYAVDQGVPVLGFVIARTDPLSRVVSAFPNPSLVELSEAVSGEARLMIVWGVVALL